MSLFDWFRWRKKPVPAAVEKMPNANTEVHRSLSAAGEVPPPSDVARWIARWTKAPSEEGASLASELEHLRDSPEVIDALSLLSAHKRDLREELALAASRLWRERGEPDKAMDMLEGRDSARALFALGGHAEASRKWETALACYERVLLRDYDFLGARERVAALREKLGIGTKQAPRRGTIVAARDEGPYRILREVARGGAGVVYEAEDRGLGRRVAMKVYHDAVRDRRQCEHEARTAVLLAGPGVIRVLDVDPERAVLILEWVEGGSLRERLRHTGTLADAQRILASTGRALGRIHARNWAHLDLKPANILLRSESGEVILTDFGIARPMGESAPRGSHGFESPSRIAGGIASPDEDLFGLARVAEALADAWGIDREKLVKETKISS